jgi:hypothetical protein
VKSVGANARTPVVTQYDVDKRPIQVGDLRLTLDAQTGVQHPLAVSRCRPVGEVGCPESRDGWNQVALVQLRRSAVQLPLFLRAHSSPRERLPALGHHGGGGDTIVTDNRYAGGAQLQFTAFGGKYEAGRSRCECMRDHAFNRRVNIRGWPALTRPSDSAGSAKGSSELGVCHGLARSFLVLVRERCAAIPSGGGRTQWLRSMPRRLQAAR